ncbi:Phox/Bem1p [Corchorus capsularis]|uniref:Phox/Bem1p n=1 Tax=Corchorus capsularis TaxID=210143 RepID=A0A1R3H1A6_COCAP|nr:Phox/Bem1p [Corchorus capsularis]
MAKGKLTAVCQSGGKFTSDSDGSLSYTGGDAHAISINTESKFDELKAEMAEMWKYDPDSLTIKYFLPHNKKTLITISNDKDLQHLLDFHGSSATVDVYVLPNENQTSHQTMSQSRSRMVDEPVTPDSITHAASVSGDTEQLDWSAPLASHSRDENPPNNLALEAPSSDNDNVLQKLVKSWENCITGLEQQFNNVLDFRVALNKFSIAHGFKYTFKTNNARYVIANCKAEGCPWSIQAARLSKTKLFIIRKMSESHTCGAGKSPLVTNHLIKFLVKEKLRDAPHAKPKEIADEIHKEYGIKARYALIWRGIESAKEKLQVPYEEGYNQLPSLFKQMIENNPGSIATLVTKDDLSFHRLFVSFQASLHGFKNGCRPLLFLDTMTIKSKYQSELLTATALDGNDGIFPVAFAVVDVVDDDNWHWFLVQLKSALSTFQQLTFVADRQIGSRRPLSMIFKNSHHGYCVRRLTEGLKEDLYVSHTEEVLHVIAAHFHDAARDTALDGFRKCIDNIRNISPEACEWIMQRGPEHWANALFQGSRYGHFSSDVAEAFYSWVTEIPDIPIAKLVETICSKIMDLMKTRQSDSGQWLTKLTPVVESKLQQEIQKASMLQVLVSLTSNFEVCDSLGVVNIVNTDLWDCSCREWQLNGFPCCHAVAVLQRTERSLYDYCSEYYTIDAFRSTYSNSINLVANANEAVKKKSTKIEVRPPVRRASASDPPKKRRIRDRHRGPFKRPLHCSKCQGAGHNRATCHIIS